MAASVLAPAAYFFPARGLCEDASDIEFFASPRSRVLRTGNEEFRTGLHPRSARVAPRMQSNGITTKIGRPRPHADS